MSGTNHTNNKDFFLYRYKETGINFYEQEKRKVGETRVKKEKNYLRSLTKTTHCEERVMKCV